MSDGARIKAIDARGRAEMILKELAPLCEKIEIAGSLRRLKADVGDAEIVALPRRANELLARLDKLVLAGTIKKALYGAQRTTRWGEKYRGLMVDGLRVEVFIADAHNWGYVWWLRTGPGDANQWIMQQCISQNAPYRAVGGYWRVHRPDQDEYSENGTTKIHVPDEQEMFRLLGIEGVMSPEGRTLQNYYRRMLPAKWAQSVTLVDDEPPQAVQATLF